MGDTDVSTPETIHAPPPALGSRVSCGGGDVAVHAAARAPHVPQGRGHGLVQLSCRLPSYAALYLAGHTVSDPYLRELHAKAASGEITVEEAGHLGEEYLCAKFGVNHE